MHPVTTVKAAGPADLIIKVTEQLGGGLDLYTPLFVSHEGLLCQRMIPMLCVYEHRLIIAGDLDDLENQERNMLELGFDYMFNVVLWNAKYLQWMSRMNSAGLKVRNAVASLAAEKEFVRAPREMELSLVEDVREGMGWKPLRDEAFVVSFPLRLS